MLLSPLARSAGKMLGGGVPSRRNHSMLLSPLARSASKMLGGGVPSTNAAVWAIRRAAAAEPKAARQALSMSFLSSHRFGGGGVSTARFCQQHLVWQRKSFSSSSSNKTSESFVEWYERHLSERPVITKMITGAFLWGVGDAVAQLVPQAVARLQSSKDNENSDDKVDATTKFEYDIPRTSRAVIFGFCLHAPTAHIHYNFLEWLTVKVGVTGMAIPFFKAFMEQFVYWSWLSNTLYHGAMGAMQGHSPDQIYQRIYDVLWETQKAQWLFWIPIQLINFRFTPVRHQLNVVLVTSIVWTALLSAWYPPEKEETKTTSKEEETTDEVAEKVSLN